MSNFIKTVIAVVVGTFVVFGLLFVLLIGLGAVIASKGDSAEKPDVKANSLLRINLNGEIPERSKEDPFARLSGGEAKTIGLTEILEDLSIAQKDNNIKGIYLDLTDVPAGQATIEAIRKRLIEVKKSGKFVYAYSEMYTERAYYLASVADKVFLNPNGMIEFDGLATEPFFIKNMLDRLGVQPEIFYAGKFKSATEPLRFTKMSDENRKQVTEYLESFYSHYMQGISKSRNIDYATLDNTSRKGLVHDAKEALQYKLVDGLIYYDEFLKMMKDKLGEKEEKDIKIVEIEEYDGMRKETSNSSDKIAVVYASGNIVDGEGDKDNIGGEKYARIFRKLRTNNDVKAIVVRVNSGGGSALASDIMWRELKLAKLKKPIIVSMGDVAASGGYYMSCMADKIYAEPNTLTGSIGVFSIIPKTQKFFEDKMGVTFDRVSTGEMSHLYSLNKPFTEAEKQILQKNTDNTYDKFLTRVAEGRSKTKEQIHEIAQGRVWSGNDALKNGLVDELGGLDDAIAFASKKAGVKSYRVSRYPEKKNAIEEFMNELSGKNKDNKEAIVKAALGDSYKFYKVIYDLKDLQGVQARLPFEIEIK